MSSTKKKLIALLCIGALACIPVGCSGDTGQDDAAQTTESDSSSDGAAQPALEDGVYTADFDTDSSMFHVSEACDGKGTLTVENGKMTIHISLASQNIVNLYPGLAEDAQKDGAYSGYRNIQ